MTKPYKLQCVRCGLTSNHALGEEYFTNDYVSETSLLEEEFEREVLLGKYGHIVKTLVEEDADGSIHCSRRPMVFQCDECESIFIHREKRVVKEDGEPLIDIEMGQNCPKCGSSKFGRTEAFQYLCPKCKKAIGCSII